MGDNPFSSNVATTLTASLYIYLSVDLVEYLLATIEEREKVIEVVNKKDQGGWSPLMSACSAGFDRVVKVLLDHGADANATNNGGQMALHYVKRSVSMAEMLIPHTEYIDKKGSATKATPLCKSIVGGNVDVVAALVEGGACVHEKNASGNTALHLAYEEGDAAIISYLIEHGAPTNATNNDKKIPSQCSRNRA